MMRKELKAKINGKKVACSLRGLWSHGFEVAFEKPITELKDEPTVIKVEVILERA